MKKKFANSIEEVRFVKEQLAKQAGYDAGKLLQLIRKINGQSSSKKPSGHKPTFRTGTDG